jgi:hypothetical protein
MRLRLELDKHEDNANYVAAIANFPKAFCDSKKAYCSHQSPFLKAGAFWLQRRK